MISYGTLPVALDENIRESLYKICQYFITLYGPPYLCKPSYIDIQWMYGHHAKVHGSPEMLGNLDYLYCEWGNCPNALYGQYTWGNPNNPTIILEVVASYDLWISNIFFWAPSSLNDINVLNISPIFNDIYIIGSHPIFRL